jgi:hypothetical protein
MQANWGVFNDEGCLESDCTEAQAKARAGQTVVDGDDLAYAAVECRDHEGHPAQSCEHCYAEAEDENNEVAGS